MTSKRQKADGVDTSTMVRLRKFHELNVCSVSTSLKLENTEMYTIL